MGWPVCYWAIRVVQTTTDVDENTESRGIVVGCYDTKDGYRLSGCGESVDSNCSNRLAQLIDRLGPRQQYMHTILHVRTMYMYNVCCAKYQFMTMSVKTSNEIRTL